MLSFPFKRPFKSYTMNTPGCITKLVLPRWYSRVDLGDYSYMNDEAEVHSFRSPQTVKIGRYCSVGRCQFVVDGDHNTGYASTYPFKELSHSKRAPENKKPKGAPVIGNDVWICDGAIIYGGVAVGDGAVIAGQAVVTRPVPPYAVVAGNPARIVKHRFSDDMVEAFLEHRWWDLPHEVVCQELAPLIDDPERFLKRLYELRM